MEQYILISGSIPAPSVGVLISAMPFGVYGEVCSQGFPAPIPVSKPQADLLQFPTSDIKVVAATPVKRRGKSMSRRTGQEGHIERSGKWWVVRWWQDIKANEKRRHMRGRICPISGQGVLSKSARERRAREIIAASGADTVEYFNQVVERRHGVTFREQAKWWLNHVKERGGSLLPLRLWKLGRAVLTTGSTQISETCLCPKSTMRF